MSFKRFGQIVVLVITLVHYSEQKWSCQGIFQPYQHDLRCYVEIDNGRPIIRKCSDGTFFNEHTCAFDNFMLHPNLHYGHTDACQLAVMGNTVPYTDHHNLPSHVQPSSHPVSTTNWEDMCRQSNGDQIVHSLNNCDSVLSIWDTLHSIRSHATCLINVITNLKDKYQHEHVSNCTCSQSRYHLNFVNVQNGLYQSCQQHSSYINVLRHLMTDIPYRQNTGELYCKSHHYIWSYLYASGIHSHSCMVDAIDHIHAALHHHKNHATCTCGDGHTSVPASVASTAMPPQKTPTSLPPVTTHRITTPSTTQHVDAFVCRDCTDYFSQTCTSSVFESCSSGNCMIKHSGGTLEMKCVEHSACQLHQISDQLNPGSKTTCCADNTCTMMALQNAVQNQLHTTTTSSPPPTTTTPVTTTTASTTQTTTTQPTTTRLLWVIVP